MLCMNPEYFNIFKEEKMNILIINDNIYVDIIEFSETLINGTSANIMCQSSRFYDIKGQDLTVQDMGEKLANIKEFSLQQEEFGIGKQV